MKSVALILIGCTCFWAPHALADETYTAVEHGDGLWCLTTSRNALVFRGDDGVKTESDVLSAKITFSGTSVTALIVTMGDSNFENSTVDTYRFYSRTNYDVARTYYMPEDKDEEHWLYKIRGNKLINHPKAKWLDNNWVHLGPYILPHFKVQGLIARLKRSKRTIYCGRP